MKQVAHELIGYDTCFKQVQFIYILNCNNFANVSHNKFLFFSVKQVAQVVVIFKRLKGKYFVQEEVVS